MIGFTISEPGVPAPVSCLFAPSGTIRRTRNAADALSVTQVAA